MSAFDISLFQLIKALIGLQNSVGKSSEPESLVHIGFFDEIGK